MVNGLANNFSSLYMQGSTRSSSVYGMTHGSSSHFEDISTRLEMQLLRYQMVFQALMCHILNKVHFMVFQILLVFHILNKMHFHQCHFLNKAFHI